MKNTADYTELTIVEIEKAIENIENVEFLQELLQFEKDNKNRAGAIDALSNRIIELTDTAKNNDTKSKNDVGDEQEKGPETEEKDDQFKELYGQLYTEAEDLREENSKLKNQVEVLNNEKTSFKQELDTQKENYLKELDKLKGKGPKENLEVTPEKLHEAILAKRRMEQELRGIKASVKSTLEKLIKDIG